MASQCCFVLHFLWKYSIVISRQNKTRVELVKDSFMKESGECFGDIKEREKTCRRVYRLSLK